MDMKAFAKRREEVMRMMGGGVAILPTAPVRTRNRDVHYHYRPDSDFYYLTHFPEPEAVAVLVPGRAHGEFILFCRENHPEKEIWDGRRAGLDGAREQYGADDAFPIDDIDDILPGLLENREKVFYSMGRFREFDQRLLGWVNEVRDKARNGVHAPGEFVDLNHILHEMRLIKRPEEIKLMKRAARITVAAHRRAMRACKPGMMEYEVEAELLHEFRKGGSEYTAYPPIVGGGRNACVLHYIDNRDELKSGDLLLIDAGAEVDAYAADLTRTFPVNGKYSGEQRAVYEIVLAAQTAAIENVRAGKHWNEPHEKAVRVLTQGLKDLKILTGDVEGHIEKGDYKRFYMHRTGHWLGMDVHDVGDYKIEDIWRELEPGMTLTIEPGLYIAQGSADVDKRWWNIGIRIEDDVLVTRDGSEVLTADAPKTVADIEACMRG
ncbi:MAG: Xaa-Pro aminopeptidase [Candidatus Muproteobacteria bacterium RBG_16_62_13]|uniref:Xaa-Pro aminopeptidase n=1 Tax=Candidatus Muproteobacteria bacterium RBG_16_62_13 TaxID=1817756 RepID=A0A1F6T5T1_9PROT|nr:MAG: Xaa-Pro aminopeptidase [Candidatus Muproteobacteria bacterium RBG_16_62_13]